MPWNFRYMARGVLHARGGADTVGENSYLLKHAPNVTGCAQMCDLDGAVLL